MNWCAVLGHAWKIGEREISAVCTRCLEARMIQFPPTESEWIKELEELAREGQAIADLRPNPSGIPLPPEPRTLHKGI